MTDCHTALCKVWRGVRKKGVPERVRGSFPGTETSDLHLKSWVKVFQGNKCLVQRKKLCHGMFKEQQQILCEYTKRMVEFAAGKRERLAREDTYMQGLSPPLSLEVMGRSCRVLSRRTLNQICILERSLWHQLEGLGALYLAREEGTYWDNMQNN